MKKSSLVKIIALMLVLCMLLSSCSILEGPVGDLLEKIGINVGRDKDEDKPPVVDTEDKGNNDDEDGPITPTCQHTSTKVINAKTQTCVAVGYTGDTVCSACGELITKGSEIPMSEHDFDDGIVTKNPTCIETGVFTYTCTVCASTKFDVMPTVAHEDEYHDALDGTHNHTCATCTAVSEYAAHTPTDAGEYHPASCTDMAYTEYTCSVCDGVYKVYDETSEATGHSYQNGWSTVDATCIKNGRRSRTCDVCGEVESVTIEATPEVHNYVFSGYEPAATCDTAGLAIYNCKDCGEFGYNKTVPATGLHNYVDLENTGDGWVRKECQNCHKIVSTFDASTLKEAEVKAENIPEDVPFEVTTEKATIEFPTDVIGQITTGTDVKIGADVLVDEAKADAINNATNLSDSEKARLESVELYDFNVKIDGLDLEGNFNAPVSVTVPYTLQTFIGEDGKEYTEDKEGIVIWFVAANGTIEKITDVVYNEDEEGNGSVTFLAPHFSMYAVAYEETPEMQCRRGHHAYKAIYTVEATCSGYGFTAYECETCLKKTIDDIVEKKLHNYGEIIAPTPTCESGDFYHRICSDCGDRYDIKNRYVRALGHTLDRVAGCTNGSVCTRCNRTVKYPLGHNFGEWRVVIPAGDFTKGLKARYCIRCGLYESVEIAPNGTVSDLGYETYEQIVNAMYDMLIGLDNGIIEVAYTINGKIDVTNVITVNRNAEGLLLRVDYVMVQNDVEMKGSAIYRNGVLISDNQGDGNTIGATNLESQIFMPLNVMLTYMESFYYYINPYAEQILTMAREELTKYLDIVAEDVNAALKAAGCEYTAEQLVDILDAIESFYAYVSQKLGYTTEAEISEDFEMPTKHDLLLLIDAVMQKEQDGDNTVYTVNADSLVASVRTVVDWVYDRCERNVASVIFELLGDKLLEIDESITDMDALVAYIQNNLPGTLTVADAIEKLETVLAESEAITLDELYEVINEVMTNMYGEEFDVEAMLEQYYELTINDLVAAMLANGSGSNSGSGSGTGDGDNNGMEKPLPSDPEVDLPVIETPEGEIEKQAEDEEYVEQDPAESEKEPENEPEKEPEEEAPEYPTAEEFYAMLGEELKGMKFGDIPMPFVFSVRMSVREFFGNIKQYLDALEIKADLSITVDKNGKLVALTVDEFVNAVMPGEEEGSTATETIQDLTVKVTRDENAKVVIPDRFAPVDFDVMSGYDEEGNLVISGIPTDFDTEAKLHGSYEMPLSELLVLNQEKTEECGFNVYTLPREMWDNNKIATTDRGYILVDGKYYDYQVLTKHVELLPHAYDVYEFDLFKFIENPYSIIPADDATPDYYFEGNPVYATGIGFLTRIEGEWCVCNAHFDYDKTEDGEIDVKIYNLEYRYKFDDRFLDKTVELSSLSEEKDNSGEWNVLCNARIIIRADEEVMEYYGISDSDGITLAYCVNKPGKEFEEDFRENRIFVLGQTVDVSNIKYDFINTRTETVMLQNGDVASEVEVTFVSYSSIVPEYYVQIAPGIYRNLNVGNDIYDYVSVDKLETMPLSDGNTMYLVGVKDAGIIGRYEGTIYYGYVKAGNKNVRTYCIVFDGVMTEIKYEHAETYRTVSYDQAFNVRENMTRLPDGTVVIAKAFIDKLKATCTDEHMYVGIKLIASKTVDGEKYAVSIDKAIKYNSGEIVIGPTISDRMNDFDVIFNVSENGDESNSYIDENGNLVLQYGHINDINAYFKDYFPADIFLNYDEQKSDEAGFDIYSYSYVDRFTTNYLYLNGKYYHYGFEQNFLIETSDLEDIIRNRWYISDIRYRYDIYPGEGTPEELHNAPVYDLQLTFIDDEYCFTYSDDRTITLYAIVLNGEIKILTGAQENGESKLTFEGYTSCEDYINSLTVTTQEEHSNQFYINGKKTVLKYTTVTMTEPTPTVNGDTVFKTIRLYKTEGGKYVSYAQYVNDHLNVHEEVTPSSSYVKTRSYEGTYCNGTFTFVAFEWTSTGKYYAIKIGGVYYDYVDFLSWCPIISREEFENYMYSSERVYRVWDDELGDWRYYDKFIPGEYIELIDELTDVTISDSYEVNVLGNTADGMTVEEVIYFLDESQPDNTDVTVITLSDGMKFYHINGIGYIEMNEDMYVKATLFTDVDGTTVPKVNNLRPAIAIDDHLDGNGMFETYISFNGQNRVVIPEELLAIMRSMPEWCDFVIMTDRGDIRFDYYSLEMAFANCGGSVGGDDYYYGEGEYNPDDKVVIEKEEI